MALSINTNVSSIRTNRAIEGTQKELARSVQRISSGVRLNSAKDDPAGLAISDRLSVQIRSIAAAIRNANDGIGLAQTAEGGLQEVTGMLQRVQELAVQASNPSGSVSTRASLQAEVKQLTSEINRISEQTEFNGQKILSGSIINANFQVGTRADETINLSIPEVSSKNLGNFFTSSDNTEIGVSSIGAANLDTSEAPENFVVAQGITLRGFNTGAVPPTVEIEDKESAQSIARKINDVEGLTGVNATAKTTMTLENIFDEGEGGTQNIAFRLYGTNKKALGETANAAFISASITEVSDLGFRPLVSAINGQKNITGITADYTGRGTIVLTHDTGADISLEAYTNTSDIEANANTAGSTPPPDELRVTGALGTEQQILTEGPDGGVTVGGGITFNSPKPFSVSSNITAQEGSLFKNTEADEPQASQFNPLAQVDISTIEGANKAIDVGANALEQITGFRGELGAIQNRFETAISNLQSIQENTQDARSRILDTDFAEEVSRFTRAQILQQAGIAILAQSNAAPFAVLQLLRG